MTKKIKYDELPENERLKIEQFLRGRLKVYYRKIRARHPKLASFFATLWMGLWGVIAFIFSAEFFVFIISIMFIMMFLIVLGAILGDSAGSFDLSGFDFSTSSDKKKKKEEE